MRKKLTRRRFLETGLAGSIAISSGTVTSLAAVPATARAQHATATLDRREREWLRAAMDEIIPAGDGMPAASEVGGVDYLERVGRENPEIKRDLVRSLSALGELSRENFKKSFLSLSRAERGKVLAQLEKKAMPDSFNTLRDYVYEAYYNQPRVWKWIGYDFYATNDSGPRMKPFDEAVLAQVRKKAKIYREAK